MRDVDKTIKILCQFVDLPDNQVTPDLRGMIEEVLSEDIPLKEFQEEMTEWTKDGSEIEWTLECKFTGYKANDSFNCSLCSDDFEEKNELREHLKSEHSVEEKDQCIFDNDELERHLEQIYGQDVPPREISRVLSIPLSDGEAAELALKKSLAGRAGSIQSVENDSILLKLNYVPEDQEELVEQIKTGEEISSKRFELTKFKEEYDLSKDALFAFWSKVVSCLDDRFCFPIGDGDKCANMRGLRHKLPRGLRKMIRTVAKYPSRRDNRKRLKKGKEELVEKGIFVEKKNSRRLPRSSRYSSLGFESHQINKKVCQRLFSPFFEEERYERDNHRERDNSSLKIPHNRDRRSLPGQREEDDEEPEVPDVTFQQVVLPKETREKIDQALMTDEEKEKVYEEWNFGDHLDVSRGTKLLFTGPPGTGKTFTAKAIGNRTGKPLMRMDFSKTVSKWLGNTGKNVRKAVEKCEENDMILFLDECDAILSERSDSSSGGEKEMDRVVNSLLQYVEEKDILIIMTTNLSSKLDKALKSRLDEIVKFQHPGRELREKLWRTKIPDSTILSEDVDFCKLADDYNLTGRGIKNAVINGAKLAAKEGKEHIHMEHFERAAKQEQGKDKPFGYNLNEDVDDPKLEIYA